MSEEPFDAELAEVEVALRKLVPAGGSVSRDQIVFRAGQNAARRRSLRFGTLGLILGAGFALGSSWMLDRLKTGPPAVVHVERPVEPQAGPATDPSSLSSAELAARWQDQASYLRLEDELSKRGLDALPPPPEPSGKQRLSLEQMLGAS